MIKLIKSKDQLRIGQTINIRDEEGVIDHKNVVIKTIGLDSFSVSTAADFFFPEESIYHYELVSMPERRRLSWDWVKEHNHVPNLKCWHLNAGEVIIKFADENVFMDDAYEIVRWEWDDASSYFIDPPHPEIPDVPEPWQTTEKKIEVVGDIEWIDDYNQEFTATHNAIITHINDFKIEGGFQIEAGENYWIHIDHINKKAWMESTRNAIANEINDHYSLWWVKFPNGTVQLTCFLKTRREVLKWGNVKYIQRFKYQPHDEKLWEEVK